MIRKALEMQGETMHEGKLEKFREAACDTGWNVFFVLAVAESDGVR